MRTRTSTSSGEILDELGIEVLFDGTFRRRDDEADASIESRLTLVEPTWDWLLDELLLTAGREEYRLRPSEAKMALERVTRDAPGEAASRRGGSRCSNRG